MFVLFLHQGILGFKTIWDMNGSTCFWANWRDSRCDHRDLDQMKMTATEVMSLPEPASSCQYSVAIDTLHDSASPGYVLSLFSGDRHTARHSVTRLRAASIQWRSTHYMIQRHQVTSCRYLVAIDTLHDTASPGYVLSLFSSDRHTA